jgi:hypothetical protein
MHGMKCKTLVEFIEFSLNGGSIEELLIEEEAERGRTIIRPGNAEWLPKADWDRLTITSQDVASVRLVAIKAAYPGTEAFRRLCEALKANALVPHVVTPTLELAQRLKMWKWKKHIRGVDFDQEVWWTPTKLSGVHRRW